MHPLQWCISGWSVSNCWTGIWNAMVEWKMGECTQLQLTSVTGTA